MALTQLHGSMIKAEFALPTGFGPCPYLGSTAPSGWVLASGRTIGNASSGATERANDDTKDLFYLLWNSLADSEAPVSSGRGASAAADFTANKTIVVPDARGRVVAGKDDMGGVAASRITSGGSGVNGTTLGASGGAETHTLSTPQIPAHNHTGTTDAGGSHSHTVLTIGGAFSAGGAQVAASTGGTQSSLNSTAPAHTHAITTANQGGGGAHNNTQPTLIVNAIVKL